MLKVQNTYIKTIGWNFQSVCIFSCDGNAIVHCVCVCVCLCVCVQWCVLCVQYVHACMWLLAPIIHLCIHTYIHVSWLRAFSIKIKGANFSTWDFDHCDEHKALVDSTLLRR